MLHLFQLLIDPSPFILHPSPACFIPATRVQTMGKQLLQTHALPVILPAFAPEIRDYRGLTLTNETVVIAFRSWKRTQNGSTWLIQLIGNNRSF